MSFLFYRDIIRIGDTMLRHKIMNAVIIVLLIITAYLGYKAYGYYKYNNEAFHDLAHVKFTGKMTIEHTELEEGEEYFEYNDIKMKNIFDDYELYNDENGSVKYINKESKDKAIFIGADEQFIYQLTSDELYKNFFLELAEKESISNDLELLKYFEAHEEDEVTFFTPLKVRKHIYTINQAKSLILPSLQYVKSVDGYYTGYIFKTNKNITEVNLLKSNRKYYFTFVGDFEEGYINELMNTVVIE